MDIKKEYERWLENKNQINFANSSCVRWLCQQSPEASHNQWTRIRS